MSFGQLLAIYRSRWKIVLLIFLITVGTAAVITKLLPKQYEAAATFVLEPRDALYGGQNPSMSGLAYVNTQLAIFTSERVAKKVVRNLKLTDVPAMRDQWRESTNGGAGDLEAWVAGLLLKNLTVEPASKSNVIDVKYRGSDPRFSAIVANSFVQAYIETSLDLRVDPAKQNVGFFDQRVKQYRENLEAAQSKLTEFQKKSGITVSDERLDVETARLNALSSQLVQLQALSSETGSRQAQARSSGDQLSDIMLNPAVSGLKADLSRQEVALQQLSSRYGDNHPQVIEARASAAELKRRLDAEVRRATGSVSVNDRISRQRESDVRVSLDAQRSRVLQLKTVRDEMAVLQREVDNAQRIYDSVLTRLTSNSLESQNTLNNATVLNPAVEPAEAAYPKVFKNMIFASVLGLIIAFATGLMLELLNRKVRSIDDVALTLGLPVLGILPAPDSRRLFGGSNNQSLLAKQVLGQLPKPQ